VPSTHPKLALPVAIATLAVALAASPALGAEAQAEPGGVATVYISAGSRGLRFVAPPSVVAGEELRVVNRTDPRRVGVNTFSLVTRGSIPRSARARRLCAAPGHICAAIASWHGLEGNGGRLAENPATAGEPGWDTPGSVFDKGDSWFAGERPGGRIEQPVTADVSNGPVRLYFMSATHPWMHGSIKVLPPA
jgi:hypothetical protein